MNTYEERKIMKQKFEKKYPDCLMFCCLLLTAIVSCLSICIDPNQKALIMYGLLCSSEGGVDTDTTNRVPCGIRLDILPRFVVFHDNDVELLLPLTEPRR